MFGEQSVMIPGPQLMLKLSAGNSDIPLLVHSYVIVFEKRGLMCKTLKARLIKFTSYI